MTFIEALDGLLSANGMSNNELARRIDVDPVQIGRWRKGRGLPRPENLIRVAAVFGVDYDWLLGLAYPEVNKGTPEPDPFETAMRARMEEMREAVRGVPRVYWAEIIKATFDHSISIARGMAQLLASSGHTVSNPSNTGVSDESLTDNSGSGSGEDHLRKRQLVRMLSLATP